jgi:hypothetical protein
MDCHCQYIVSFDAVLGDLPKLGVDGLHLVTGILTRVLNYIQQAPCQLVSISTLIMGMSKFGHLLLMPCQAS